MWGSTLHPHYTTLHPQKLLMRFTQVSDLATPTYLVQRGCLELTCLGGTARVPFNFCLSGTARAPYLLWLPSLASMSNCRRYSALAVPLKQGIPSPYHSNKEFPRCTTQPRNSLAVPLKQGVVSSPMRNIPIYFLIISYRFFLSYARYKCGDAYALLAKQA